MQQALRPYATAGIAIVGAGLLAGPPVLAPAAAPVSRAVQLTSGDSWTDLFNDTSANLQNIFSNADQSAISTALSDLFTNPLGVIKALTDITPDVAVHATSLPATISVDLPPGLALAVASLGAQGATDNAINQVVTQLAGGDSSALLNGLPTILNAYLNGQDNLNLLGGIVNIPVFNGVLAPLQPLDIDLNLTKLLDALGLGNLDLSGLLGKLGDLGNLTLGGLLSDLGISGDGLGTLLSNNGITSLSGLLNLLGLNGLDLGKLDISSILSGLGLNTTLNNLSLDSLLTAVGLNGSFSSPLSGLLSAVGLGGLLNDSLSSLLPTSTLQSIASSLNGVLGNILNPLTGSNVSSALSGITLGSLLGSQNATGSIDSLLSALGVTAPSSLTIGGILQDLGLPTSTGDLTLGNLLNDLGGGLGNLNITSLLNGLNLGDLFNDLGLSKLPLNLGNLLGDLTNLNLGQLLNDLGLGDLAAVTVSPIGGELTELVDTIPQQIVAALGG